MTGRDENSSLILHQVKQINKMIEIMKIKLKIMTTLLGVFFGCGIAASQTPKAGQAMDLSLIHISEPTRLGMISYAVFCLKKKNISDQIQSPTP